MVKPFHILRLFIYFFLAGLIFSFIFPDNGIPVKDKFTLRFWKPADLFQKDEYKKEELEAILKKSTELSDSVASTAVLKDTSRREEILDSIIRNYKDTLRTNICFLEFPSGDSSLLNAFFEKLGNPSGKGPVRIMHYGDSQIEADRITSFLRRSFQRDFGGKGIGFFPLTSIRDFSRFIVGDYSSNWEKYGINGKKTNLHGILGSFARASIVTENSSSDSTKESKTYLKLKRLGKIRAPEQSFTRCNLLYRLDGSTAEVNFENNRQAGSLSLSRAKDIGFASLPLTELSDVLSIQFPGKAVPDIFGISLDDTVGVAVDNIPLRGVAIPDFYRMDSILLQKTDSLLNLGLLILEFGANVATSEAKSFGYYRDMIVKQVGLFRRICPDVPVILMGVSDISGKEGRGFSSLSSIEKIRKAQKEAAKITDCVFWDTYQAMGGKNSMPAWVLHDPPLAQKDFIHFTPSGANLIAEMLYNAIMLDYYTFQRKNNIAIK